MRYTGPLSLAAALVVAVLVFVAAPHGSSVGETSCTRIVHNYLTAAANAVGVTLAHEHLIACHQDGHTSVARVEFDATIQAAGTTTHEILALRLVKSPWSVADAHLVG